MTHTRQPSEKIGNYSHLNCFLKAFATLIQWGEVDWTVDAVVLVGLHVTLTCNRKLKVVTLVPG